MTESDYEAGCDDDQLQQESHYYSILAWFSYYWLELGPKKVYADICKQVDDDLAYKVEHEGWGAKELGRYVYESAQVESNGA